MSLPQQQVSPTPWSQLATDGEGRCPPIGLALPLPAFLSHPATALLLSPSLLPSLCPTFLDNYIFWQQPFCVLWSKRSSLWPFPKYYFQPGHAILFFCCIPGHKRSGALPGGQTLVWRPPGLTIMWTIKEHLRKISESM